MSNQTFGTLVTDKLNIIIYTRIGKKNNAVDVYEVKSWMGDLFQSPLTASWQFYLDRI